MEEILNDNVKKNSESTETFCVPVNVKQMGNIDRRIKIYMEDYVHTYLYQYAKTQGGCEKLAVLLGRYELSNNIPVLVISGAVKVPNSVGEDNAYAHFDEQAWEYVNKQVKKYFKDVSVVGWVHSQPEMGIFLSRYDEEFHKKCFKSPLDVLWVIDHTEDIDCFYLYNEEGNMLCPSKGYFIYYDKNEGMQDYMIENSFSKPKTVEEDEDTQYIDISKRIDAAKKIRTVLNKKEETKKQLKKGKYVALSSACAVFFAIFVFMGFGMAKNVSKINMLEQELSQMKNSYAQMNEKIENANDEFFKTEEVFSVQQANAEGKKEEQNDKNTEENENKQVAAKGEYTLQYGDTIWELCKRFYGSENRIEDILAANNLTQEDVIYVGEKIIIPE